MVATEHTPVQPTSLHDLQSDLRTLRLESSKGKGPADRRRSSGGTSGALRNRAKRRSSARYSNRLELQKIFVYEKNTFMNTAIRNPITGQVRLEGVEEWLDFAFVDLWTRPQLLATPDQLSQDKYMLKPKPLLYRSWVYHGLHSKENQLEFEEEDETEPAVVQALKTPCIDANVSGGRWSPVMVLAPQLFPVVLVGNFVLILVCLITFLFCLFLAVNINTHQYYRAQRIVTFPIRLIFIIILFDSVSVPSLLNQGLIIQAIGYIIAVGMSMVDLFLGDGVAMLCRQLECTYEPIRELPHNVWVCKKKDGQPTGATGSMQDKRDRGKIDKGITGVPNWDECTDLALIADVDGLLVELIKPSKDEWNAFFDIYRRSGQPIKYMGQECFNVMKQTLEDIEDPTRRLKNRSLAGFYLVPLQDGRLVTRDEVESGKIEVEDYNESDDESP
jgi:hypothetical protein